MSAAAKAVRTLVLVLNKQHVLRQMLQLKCSNLSDSSQMPLNIMHASTCTITLLCPVLELNPTPFRNDACLVFPRVCIT